MFRHKAVILNQNSQESLSNSDRRLAAQTKIVLSCAILVVLLLVASLGWNCLVYWAGEGIAAHGQFGDSFGALNAVASSFALLAILWSVQIQSQELALQRQELAETRRVLNEQAKAAESGSQSQREISKATREAAEAQLLSSQLQIARYQREYAISLAGSPSTNSLEVLKKGIIDYCSRGSERDPLGDPWVKQIVRAERMAERGHFSVTDYCIQMGLVESRLLLEALSQINEEGMKNPRNGNVLTLCKQFSDRVKTSLHDELGYML